MLEWPAVKLCGLRRREDVDLALDQGADALGFVHYERSPRHAGLAEIAELCQAVGPAAVCVLVVVDVEPATLHGWAIDSGVGMVQLCGAEDPQDFKDFPLPILRRVGVDVDAEAELEAWRPVARGFVLDHPAAPGGTGLGVDLQRAADLAQRAPCLLAGGIDGSNVAGRVAQVQPHGVDASSRLEIRPGVKDPGAVRSYLVAAHRALASLGERQ